MKVLVTVPHLELCGGVANYYRTLRPYLPEESVIYFEIGCRPGESGGWQQFARLVGDMREFRRILAREPIDLVHLNPSLLRNVLIREGLMLLLAKIYKKHVLIFFRGWDPKVASIITRYFSLPFRLVYGQADAFIVLAAQFEQQLKSWGIKNPIFRDTTVVADTIFDAITESKADHNQSQPTVILYMSRLDFGKGAPEAVETLGHLNEKGLNVKLLLAGNGPEKVTAQRVASERRIDNVEFLGEITGVQKEKVFAQADIFFFPTFYGEGMPNTVLEAMAHGLPVVTRTAGGIADFFQNEKMGFATDSDSCHQFADMLELLITDARLRTEIGQFNRHYADDHFRASKVASRLTAIYTHV